MNTNDMVSSLKKAVLEAFLEGRPEGCICTVTVQMEFLGKDTHRMYAFPTPQQMLGCPVHCTHYGYAVGETCACGHIVTEEE